jgi:hypothetical protein
MDALTNLFKAIPAAAASPLALVAYLAAVVCTIFINLRTARLQALLKKIDLFPKADRRAMVEKELQVVLPESISAEDHIRLKRQTYLFIWFLCVLAVIVIVVAISAFTARATALLKIAQDATILVASDDAKDGRVPIGAQFAVSVPNVPESEEVTWSNPSHGKISQHKGSSILYSAESVGFEQLEATVESEGVQVKKSISFEVVNPFH